MRKLIVVLPFTLFALLAILIIAVNMTDSESAVVSEVENIGATVYSPEKEVGEGQAIKHNPNREASDFVYELYEEWNRISLEERFSVDVNNGNYRIISSVIPHVGFYHQAIEQLQLTEEFESLKETAHKLTSRTVPLTDEERKTLLDWFDTQLDSIYAEVKDME